MTVQAFGVWFTLLDDTLGILLSTLPIDINIRKKRNTTGNFNETIGTNEIMSSKDFVNKLC
jgi:hypothetical protein